MYIPDELYKDFLKAIRELLNNKEKLKKTFKTINNIK
jgi:hypothetical protein